VKKQKINLGLFGLDTGQVRKKEQKECQVTLTFFFFPLTFPCTFFSEWFKPLSAITDPIEPIFYRFVVSLFLTVSLCLLLELELHSLGVPDDQTTTTTTTTANRIQSIQTCQRGSPLWWRIVRSGLRDRSSALTSSCRSGTVDFRFSGLQHHYPSRQQTPRRTRRRNTRFRLE